MALTLKAWVSTAWVVAQVAAAGTWDARMERAIALRLSGHEEEALALFRDAEKEKTSPRFLAQMALTEQSLGLWVDAEKHLERALASGEDVWIAKNQAALRGARDTIREHVGTLELRGDLRGELRVDGRTVGGLPGSSPLRLQVGPHRVEVVHSEAYPFQRDVEIRAGQTARETIALAPLPPREDARSASSPPLHVDTVPASSSSSAPGIVLVSVGGAAALGGVALLLASNSRASAYNDNAACLGRPTDPAACEDDASAMRTYRTLSIASFVTAGVSGLVGGWLLWRAGKSTTPLSAAVSSTGVQITFGQAF